MNKINDIDVATTLTPSEVIRKFFQNSNIEVKKTGIEHGNTHINFKRSKV